MIDADTNSSIFYCVLAWNIIDAFEGQCLMNINKYLIHISEVNYRNESLISFLSFHQLYIRHTVMQRVQMTKPIES